ncbi:MAG: type II toxin-antitoxin system RelE/ParE family toxin [Hyphomicrobiales bacterium]|nr:type II toxin-antitoxin system RelE/ParE family toxin [Hyphomicrobiales bacterium]
MIRSFGDRRTQRFAQGEFVKAFESIKVAARRRLAVLDAADSLDVLAALRGNRLEVLRGKRKGQLSIRINEQWRICFRWNDAEKSAEQVEIVDYH